MTIDRALNVSKERLDPWRGDPDHWQLLLNEIFKERHIDFSQYQEKLLERRVATRLRAAKKVSYKEYVSYLRGNGEEMDALLDALTINTTQFFRDRKVFDAIRKKVLPQILTWEVIDRRKIVRIWSAGCSGGDEATSLLVLIAEYLLHRQSLRGPVGAEAISEIASSPPSGTPRNDGGVHIYGTDIDRWSIEKAKAGVYEESEFREMPSELRDKYFLDMGNGRFWRRKEWNRFLTFLEHDLVRNPPLRQMDLLLCRNTFIYFKRELQTLCLQKFAQALKKDGFLILGLTESLWDGMRKIFVEFDRENRIYRKVA